MNLPNCFKFRKKETMVERVNCEKCSMPKTNDSPTIHKSILFSLLLVKKIIWMIGVLRRTVVCD